MHSFDSNDFSYDNYRRLLTFLDNEYEIFSFKDAYRLGAKILDVPRFVILRHDVEFSVKGALALARIEHELGIKSTFFFLQTSDYNCFDRHEAERIREIISLGHDVGLHYDASLFEDMKVDPVVAAKLQIKLFECFFNVKVHAMSSHMPMRSGKAFSIDGVIDTYDPLYLRDIKYISDSNQVWRENISTKGLLEHQQIHLLLHENTWSDDGLSIFEISLAEAFEKFQKHHTNALKYNSMVKVGLKNRAVKDNEFKKRYFSSN
ncbi:hypothetical protein BFR57_02500 [Idiomarina sp. MD25a]|uniref:hypothetical protein n=1 Tax=Idiomarina sp. MD25a TaxID=1889913 RepID=UPI0008F80759|nr:hypothetical protein [Idiomarina sp. MD25a]OIM99455.1 hypothetical protein BFR57_02500 [Idiomarina sp. MD25a]